MFAYDFHAGGETMMSRHFNEPSADVYFTKRKWGKEQMQAGCVLTNAFALWESRLYFKNIRKFISVVIPLYYPIAF